MFKPGYYVGRLSAAVTDTQSSRYLYVSLFSFSLGSFTSERVRSSFSPNSSHLSS